MKGFSSSAIPSCRNAMVKNASRKLKKRMLAASHPQGEWCESGDESVPDLTHNAIGALLGPETAPNVDKPRTNDHPRSEMTAARGQAATDDASGCGIACPTPWIARLAWLAAGL